LLLGIFELAQDIRILRDDLRKSGSELPLQFPAIGSRDVVHFVVSLRRERDNGSVGQKGYKKARSIILGAAPGDRKFQALVQLDRRVVLGADKLNDVAAEAFFVRLGQTQGDEIAAAVGRLSLGSLAYELGGDEECLGLRPGRECVMRCHSPQSKQGPFAR